MADSQTGQGLNHQQVLRAGLNGQGSHLKQVMSLGLKHPTQSQVANGNLKVHNLNV